MTRKKKPDPILQLADGSTGRRRFKTSIWHDLRLVDPSPWSSGFPRAEEGSINTAARLVMTGKAAQVQCEDRVRGRIEWTVRRGPRVPRTPLYEPIICKGEPAFENKPSRRRER